MTSSLRWIVVIAFHSVSSRLVCCFRHSCLRNYFGIDDLSLNWFSSYLSSCYQAYSFHQWSHLSILYSSLWGTSKIRSWSPTSTNLSFGNDITTESAHLLAILVSSLTQICHFWLNLFFSKHIYRLPTATTGHKGLSQQQNTIPKAKIKMENNNYSKMWMMNSADWWVILILCTRQHMS